MKISKEKLQQMIMKELTQLDEKFTQSDMVNFGSFDKVQAGPDKLGGTVDGADLWTMHDKGTDKSMLDVSDIKYYQQNPEKIDVGVQRRLVAISRAGAGGDSTKYKQNLADLMVADNNFAAGGLDTNGMPKDATAQQISKGPSRTAYNKRAAKYRFYAKAGNETYLMQMAKEAEKALAELEKAIGKAGERTQTVTNPEFKSQRGETGAFPPEQVAVVNRLLGSMGDIQSRIKEVSRIAKKYYDAATGAAGAADSLNTEVLADPAKVLTEIQLIDLFNTMVKEIDSGSGAYVFEYFLALISGGQVAGKLKTAGGKMGAADFLMGSEYGSAKFFKDKANVKQATSGYEDLFRTANNLKSEDPIPQNPKPVEVTYVVGLKKQDVKQTSQAATGSRDKEAKKRFGSSDPARIIGVEIFTPKVKYDGTSYQIDGKKSTPKGKSIVKGGDVVLDSNLGDSQGVIFIAELRTKTFREMIASAINRTNETMKDLFKEFQTYFDMLSEADEGAKMYVAEDDANNRATKAAQVYNSLTGAKGNFDKLKAALDNPTFTQADKTAIGENKKNQINSLKALDKLIEQVILYKNTEEK